MTYSIVARDPETGELGVAVQSHWFSVGSIVSWARAGGRRGGDPVDRRAGVRAAAARPARCRRSAGRGARAGLAADELARFRQVAVVDAAGAVAAHTGDGCIAIGRRTWRATASAPRRT